MAAVLALGQGAALSHRPAAELWVLLVPRTGSIDVSVPGRGGREKRPGLRIHRSPSLTSAVTTTRRGIAVTTPARTLADLHRVASPVEYRRAVRQAEVSGYELGGVEVDGTRSELERLVLRLCRRYRLPPPEVNQRVGPYLVDFLWRERRLVVEVDGWRYHRGRQAFDDDRARDVQLQLHGYRVARFADRQLERDSVAVVAAIRRLLED
jgi:very-short-patch-repair endonuclease